MTQWANAAMAWVSSIAQRVSTQQRSSDHGHRSGIRFSFGSHTHKTAVLSAPQTIPNRHRSSGNDSLELCDARLLHVDAFISCRTAAGGHLYRQRPMHKMCTSAASPSDGAINRCIDPAVCLWTNIDSNLLCLLLTHAIVSVY